MKNIEIEKTNQTPEIKLNAQTGELSFIGRSLPEDSTTFYEEVFKWIDDYSNNLADKTLVIFELDYFNTSSAKAIFSIIVKFDKLFQSSYPIKIQWLFDDDDEDMKELGKEYKELFKIPIELVEKPS
jgi:hypothetical protein